MLPQIKHPTYKLTIPSTQKEIEYRPFLVKEEKLLLMASESKDIDVISSAMEDIVKSCVLSEIDVNSLAVFDIEFIFLKIRGKSIGETIDIDVKCSECGKFTPVSINIDDIKMDTSKLKEKEIVMITDDIGVELRPFTFNAAKELSKVDDSSEIFVEAIRLSTTSIFDKDEVYDMKNVSQKEFSDWLSTLSTKQLEKIGKYVDSLPQLTHTVEFTCIHCGHTEKYTLKGIQDFFE